MMKRLIRRVGIPIGISAAALAIVGVVLAAIVSNVLTLGPFQVIAPQFVVLTTVQDLPSGIIIGQENSFKFKIEASDDVSDATLWLELSATGETLSDFSIADLLYEHPGESSFTTISLTASGGKLKGALKSAWNIADGFDGTGEGKITFNSGAPTASYSINLWVEGSVDGGGGGSGGTVRSFSMENHTSGNIGLSGTSADGTSIIGVRNPELVVKAGESVEMVSVWGTGKHNFAVYTAPCLDGWCDANLVVRSADVSSTNTQATVTFSFPTANTTYYWVCDYHPAASQQSGIITVIP